MNFCFYIFLFIITSSADVINKNNFPSDFLFGVSTSAYQIEGGWNQDGKGESVWDYITHQTPVAIADRSNGDVACDSYNQLKEDIKMLKNLKVNIYRFSLSWSRIVPTGRVNEGINLQGIMYYQNLIRELKKENITPMVTIFHFDPPLKLMMEKIFINETLNSLFVDYARLAFMLFGSEVKYWITFNEPREVCTDFIENFSNHPGVDTYKCAHNIIKCHAMVYHMYEEEFKELHNGQISIVLNTNWDEPASTALSDIEAAERKLLFEFGWFAHPIIFGDYPDIMKIKIKDHTFPLLPNRLPKFTDEEKKYIKGTVDFIGLNHYTTSYVSDNPNKDFFRSFEKDMEISISYDPSWERASLEWLYVVPFGMRKILKWIHTTYNVPIFITENGYVENGTLVDDRRINYLETYLSKVLDAIYYDKVEVLGYSVWSLMDNFEWTSGYTQKFGLYYVNFTDPHRERIPKKSVEYFKKILETRCLVDSCTKTDLENTEK